jgi:hypothetical protein
MWGRLMDCFYCLSLWIALPFALLCGEGWIERLVLWPALSAGAILVERVNGGLPSQPPFPPVEEVVAPSDPQACEKKEA